MYTPYLPVAVSREPRAEAAVKANDERLSRGMSKQASKQASKYREPARASATLASALRVLVSPRKRGRSTLSCARRAEYQTDPAKQLADARQAIIALSGCARLRKSGRRNSRFDCRKSRNPSLSANRLLYYIILLLIAPLIGLGTFAKHEGHCTRHGSCRSCRTSANEPLDHLARRLCRGYLRKITEASLFNVTPMKIQLCSR